MRKYDKEFEEETVKLSDEVGIKQAAAQLNENERRLMKENAELHKTNEILKDALGLFAKDRKK